MPRPRKPTEVLKLVGAFRKNPNRTRPASPKSDREIGDAPDYLSVSEKAAWHEIVENAAEGVIISSDAILLEILSRLLAKLRLDWVTGQESSQLCWCLVRLGMTPADRSRIMGSQETPSNPFSEFSDSD